MRALIVIFLAASVGGCAAEYKPNRYVDPYTCEIENPKPGEPSYDADCIRAAQNAAEAAAKKSKKK